MRSRLLLGMDNHNRQAISETTDPIKLRANNSLTIPIDEPPFVLDQNGCAPLREVESKSVRGGNCPLTLFVDIAVWSDQ